MDLEGIMLCEISHTEKNKYGVISLICMDSKKTKQVNNHNKRQTES